MRDQRERLSAALDGLAALFEFGDLEPASDAAGLIERASAEIERLRVDIPRAAPMVFGTSYSFTVPGKPQAKERPRVYQGRGVTEPRTKAYEQRVRIFARQAVRKQLTGPVRVDILAVLDRPKRLVQATHGYTNATAPDGLMYAPVRPDSDNIRKSILDGLDGVLVDDGQVVAGETLKVYAEKGGSARAVVVITELVGLPPDTEAEWMEGVSVSDH